MLHMKGVNVSEQSCLLFVKSRQRKMWENGPERLEETTVVFVVSFNQSDI